MWIQPPHHVRCGPKLGQSQLVDLNEDPFQNSSREKMVLVIHTVESLTVNDTNHSEYLYRLLCAVL